jgi:hypothetical protein
LKYTRRGCISVVEHLPSMHEILGPILSKKKRKEKVQKSLKKKTSTHVLGKII